MAAPSIPPRAATTPDFRLGGFEFCLRVAELNKASLHVIAKSRPVGSVIFSFLDDWRALGQIVADLMALMQTSSKEQIQFIEGRAKIDLRASEIDLIRLLFGPERAGLGIAGGHPTTRVWWEHEPPGTVPRCAPRTSAVWVSPPSRSCPR